MEAVFTTQNQWIRLSAQKATVGLVGDVIKGDVVYIELPAIGLHVQKGEPCATVESIKGISEVYAPVSGVISAVNDHVYDDPDTVRDTWLFKMDFEGDADLSGWTKKV